MRLNENEEQNRYGFLTPRQKLFCEAYAMDPCGERAAIIAGYQKNSARQQASRLLTYDNIKKHIREIQEAESEFRVLTATEIRMFWSSVVRDETQRMSDRLQASVNLAKSSGIFQTAVKMDVHDEEGKNTLNQQCRVVIYLPERDPEPE